MVVKKATVTSSQHNSSWCLLLYSKYLPVKDLTLGMLNESSRPEADRQLKLLDGILAGQSFVAGDECSIADIAHFGWIWRRAFPALTLDEVPHVQRWYDAMIARPAVTKAIGRLEQLANANG